MKKTIFAALLLALLLFCPAVLANGWGLPGGLVELFDGAPAYLDYTLGTSDQHTAKNSPGYRAVFMMESRYHNELFVACRQDGAYQIEGQSTAALRQTGWEDSGLEIAMLDDMRFEIRYPGEVYRFVRGSEDWKLEYVQIDETGFTLTLNSEGYHYTAEQDGESETWYISALTLNMENDYGYWVNDIFSIDAIPRSMEEMRRVMHNAQLLPQGRYIEVLLENVGDVSLPVYSAPDQDAVRFGNGKAAVSLKEKVTVIDWRDGYVMLSYDVSNRTSRIGYVQEHSLLTGAIEATEHDEQDFFGYLNRWGRIEARAVSDTALTDDPFVSRYQQVALAAGETVTVLTAWDSLHAIVETKLEGKTVRGFVPLCDLAIPEPPQDEAVMQALVGTEWQMDAGGSMYADLKCFLENGEVLCDWGYDDTDMQQARIARYSVSRYDPAWGLYWRDVPYMITYTDADGDVHRYGMEFDEDELNLVTNEGGGGFVPYTGDLNEMVEGLRQARMQSGPALKESKAESLSYYREEDVREGVKAIHYTPEGADSYVSVYLYFIEETGVWFPGEVVGGELYHILPNAIDDGSMISMGRNDAYHYGDHPWANAEGLDVTTIPLSVEEALLQLDNSGWAVVNNPNPADRLHLRVKPDRGSNSLGKFYNRTPVRVLEVAGDWALVRVGTLEGYMMKKYLAFGDEMSGVACAFPQMTHREEYLESGVPVYAHPTKNSPQLFVDEGDAYIVGVYGDEWYIVLDPQSENAGYVRQSDYTAGNG